MLAAAPAVHWRDVRELEPYEGDGRRRGGGGLVVLGGIQGGQIFRRGGEGKSSWRPAHCFSFRQRLVRSQSHSPPQSHSPSVARVRVNVVLGFVCVIVL